MALKRKQVYLGRGSDEMLKKWAAQKGVSEAFLVREAVDSYLARLEQGEAEVASTDPLLRLVALYKGDIPPDLAEQHDRYLDREDDDR
jgi:hypothetical protein